jgi:hypothetical protein
MKVHLVLPFVIIFGLSCQAQDISKSAGQQGRGIKALSETDVSAYLNGHGMGFAKAAELNGYPGPAHVLDLAKELALMPKQRAKAQELIDSMSKAAVFGTKLINLEQQLDSFFPRRSQ